MYTFTYIRSERLKAEYRDTAFYFFTAIFLSSIKTFSKLNQSNLVLYIQLSRFPWWSKIILLQGFVIASAVTHLRILDISRL